MKIQKTPLYTPIGARDSALCRIYAGIFLVPCAATHIIDMRISFGDRALISYAVTDEIVIDFNVIFARGFAFCYAVTLTVSID